MLGSNGDGPLSNGWSWVRLGEVCEFLPARSLSSDGDVEVDVITSACLTDTGFDPSGIKRARMRAPDVESAVVSPGEILVARSNTPELVGRVAVFPGSHTPVVASDLTIRIVTLATHYQEVLAYYLRALHLSGYWKDHAGGASGSMKKIRRVQVQNLLVPFHSASEHQRLTELLSESIATLLRAKIACAAQLEAAKSLPAAFLREVFNSGTAKTWPLRRVAEVARVTGGVQKSPQRVPMEFFRPYLTVRNVQQGWLDLTELEQFEISPSELDKLRLEAGDMLVVEGSGSLSHIGRCAVFRGEVDDCVHQNHVIRVRFDGRVCDPDYAYLYLSSPAGRLEMVRKAQTSSGLYNLGVSSVEQLTIPVPDLRIQQIVVEQLTAEKSAAERARAAIEAQLTEINSLPAVLLQEAFSGGF